MRWMTGWREEAEKTEKYPDVPGRTECQASKEDITMNRKKHTITIAGAGSARVPSLVGNLIEMKERFPLNKIIFYDIDEERMGKMEAYDRLVLKTY